MAENRDVARGVAGVSFCTPYRLHITCSAVGSLTSRNLICFSLILYLNAYKNGLNIFQFKS
jgi:hypothetical protein